MQEVNTIQEIRINDGFLLRIMEKKDAAAFHNLIQRNYARLEDFLAGTVARTKTIEETAIFIEENTIKNQENTYMPFVLHDLQAGKIIGFIDVKHIDLKIPKAELGCFIDREYESKGISKQSIQALIRVMFNDLKFHKLFLRTHPSNKSARTLAEHCGFEVEGIIRSDYKTTKGELIDLVFYGLLNT